MIKVDISNVWGQIALPDLLAMEKEVAQAHTTLVDGTGAGNDFLGWQNLPTREPTEEILRIQSAARKIRNDSDVFVVIGTSLNVYPAAGLLNYVPSGVPIYLIDPQPVHVTSGRRVTHLMKGASEGMEELTGLLKK